ncbi:MAG: MarR family winged helix-turn-helix transcriptional regulator [Pseudomonadota bacterium]
MSDPAFRKQDFETLSGFRHQLRRFQRWSEQLTRRAGVTNLQYLLLLHLKGFPGREWATISELAGRLLAQHHGTVALVTRCEKLGLVERRPGRTDGREVEVHLTAKGEKLVGRLARQHRDELMRVEGIFAVPGRAQLSGAPARPDPGQLPDE